MLKRPGDFEQFLGSTVLVRLYKPVDGRKEVVGTLTGYEDGAVTVTVNDRPVRFEKMRSRWCGCMWSFKEEYRKHER